jgi:hypothetical protein
MPEYRIRHRVGDHEGNRCESVLGRRRSARHGGVGRHGVWCRWAGGISRSVDGACVRRSAHDAGIDRQANIGAPGRAGKPALRHQLSGARPSRDRRDFRRQVVVEGGGSIQHRRLGSIVVGCARAARCRGRDRLRIGGSDRALRRGDRRRPRRRFPHGHKRSKAEAGR